MQRRVCNSAGRCNDVDWSPRRWPDGEHCLLASLALLGRTVSQVGLTCRAKQFHYEGSPVRNGNRRQHCGLIIFGAVIGAIARPGNMNKRGIDWIRREISLAAAVVFALGYTAVTRKS
jgi:hypothetical protein